MHVANRVHAFDGGRTPISSVAPTTPGFECLRRRSNMVIASTVVTASQRVDATAFIVVRAFARILRSKSQGFHPTCRVVSNLCINAAIGLSTLSDPRRVTPFQIVVAVPTAAEDLDETHSVFNQGAAPSNTDGQSGLGIRIIVNTVHLDAFVADSRLQAQ